MIEQYKDDAYPNLINQKQDSSEAFITNIVNNDAVA